MALDSASGNGLTLLSSDEKMSGSVTISSPLLSQDHGMTISYFGGQPHAIRGDINVKENGSHKTLTEIDFEDLNSYPSFGNFIDTLGGSLSLNPINIRYAKAPANK